MSGCTNVRYNRRQTGGRTAVRYNRRQTGGRTDFPGTARRRKLKVAQLLIHLAKLHEIWPHLPKDIRNLFQSKITEIYAKIPIFFNLNEGGSKTEPNAKYDLETCSWVVDDQDDPRWVPTCHSKLYHGKKPSKNSQIKERPQITK